MVFLLVYWFGRTAYQLTFFVKAGMMRYWYHPLMKQRPIPCGTDTPPFDELLAPLAAEASKRSRDDWAGDDKGGDEDGAIFARRWNRRGKGGRAESWTEIISAVGCDVAGIVVEDEAGTRGSGWAEVVDVEIHRRQRGRLKEWRRLPGRNGSRFCRCVQERRVHLHGERGE